MKAIIDGAVVADAPEADLISIEGNYYFPPSSISAGVLSDSTTPYNCPWKGDASYYNVVVGDGRNEDAAWYYPEPYDAAALIKDHIAFWKGVEVSGTNADTREILPPARK